MTARATSVVALLTVLWSLGCFAGRPVRQTSITTTRVQEAVVLPPEAPVGFGAALPVGASSLTAGGGFTMVEPSADVGQQVLPLAGLVRGATAVDRGLELTASGSLGSPKVEAGPIRSGVTSLDGVLGRGAIGLRTFVQPDSLVQWGWSFDVGAETTYVQVTDLTTVAVRTRAGTEVTEDSVMTDALRVHPHARASTIVRVPLPAGVAMMGGAQLQTWPVYWSSRAVNDTCTTFSTGSVECTTEGTLDVAPSPMAAVFTPTLGAAFHADGVSVLVQGYANLGTDGVEAAPWGAMAALEYRVPSGR